MFIKQMSDYDIREMVHKTQIGHLAYIHEGRPVIVAMGFHFSGGSLYALTTAGQKTEAMRENNAVAVYFEEIEARNKWRTVSIEGRYSELNTDEERQAIANLLSSNPTWWEPAYVRTVGKDGKDRKLEPVFFRIDIDSLSGHETH